MQAYSNSVKMGECSVDVYAPEIDTESQMYLGKLHLTRANSVDTFCGTQATLWLINAGDFEWVTQADPEGQLCQRCKRAAIKYLKSEQAKHDTTPSA
ncbi:hypothetical protein [Vibrio sp. Hal054]|uniref:hypothetical protein n=1 Tax=Vibrio sp. Hal054 TaxID=3035158 RepID=UPI00301DE9B6